jgi:hypothetical protein
MLIQLGCRGPQPLCFAAKLVGGWFVLWHGNHDATIADAKARLWKLKLMHYPTFVRLDVAVEST